jgi:ABC-type multidrug transport system fused ATPase/permease subunit
VDPALEPSEKHTVIGRQMVQVLALHALGCLLGFLKGALYGVSGERVVARLRNRLFASILRQEVAFFDQRKTGELVSRLGTDAQSGRYKVELKGAPWQDDEVTLMVKPENVLPLSRPMQTMAMDMTREEMEEEDAEFEAEFGDEFGEPNDDYDDDDDDDDDDYE